MRRGHRVGTTIAVLIAVGMLVAGSAEVGMAAKTDLSAHRNLFNGDFGFFFWNAEMWQPEGGRYTADAIRRAVDNLVDNGVDTVILNPNSRVAWYPSNVIPTVTDHYVRDTNPGGSAWFTKEVLNPILDLKEDGVDWLDVAVTRCHERGVSVWASIRMSDPHTSPSSHLSPPGALGSNYRYSSVRAQYFAFASELVNDYDFDGLELDWLRCPELCADASYTNTMTAWFASVRGLCDAKAAINGEPFTLGMRIPERYTEWKERGVDIEAVIEDGTLDYICPSNFMQTTWDTPHDDLKDAFGEDVTIYGATGLFVNDLQVWSDDLNRSLQAYNNACPQALRGNAAGKLALGADGIQQYNFFVSDMVRRVHGVAGLRGCYEALPNLDDLEALRGRSKLYSVCSGVDHATGGQQYDAPRPLPETLGVNGELVLHVPMCDEPDDTGLELIIQVIVGKQAGLDQNITVCFNGVLCLEDAEPTTELLFPFGPFNRLMSDNQGYNYRFPIDLIGEGWNEVVLLNAAGQSVTIDGVGLSVASIPEPATWLLLLIGGLCLVGFCRGGANPNTLKG